MKLFAFALLTCVLLPLSAVAQTPAKQEGGMGTEKAPVPPSKSVNVTFEGRVTTLTVSDLLNLPQVTVHIHNAHRNTDETYSGPLVSDVLARAGLKSSRETEPLILHSSLVATGTDHYFVLYSVAEVEPSFSTGQVIIAVTKEGLPDTEGGVLQLVNTADAKPARWVHGLADLNIVSMAPSH
jgi:hypothetical protein